MKPLEPLPRTFEDNEDNEDNVLEGRWHASVLPYALHAADISAQRGNTAPGDVCPAATRSFPNANLRFLSSFSTLCCAVVQGGLVRFF